MLALLVTITLMRRRRWDFFMNLDAQWTSAHHFNYRYLVTSLPSSSFPFRRHLFFTAFFPKSFLFMIFSYYQSQILFFSNSIGSYSSLIILNTFTQTSFSKSKIRFIFSMSLMIVCSSSKDVVLKPDGLCLVFEYENGLPDLGKILLHIPTTLFPTCKISYLSIFINVWNLSF